LAEKLRLGSSRANGTWLATITRAMKLTYKMARDGREWWADCVEVDAFAGGRTAYEAVCRLRALLVERLRAEDAAFQAHFGSFDLTPAATAYIDAPISSR
jgi:hypothetical protein